VSKCILVTIIVFLSTLFFAEYAEITITATGINHQQLEEKIKIKALEKFTLSFMDEPTEYQKQLAAQYYMIYRPLGYVKDIKILEEKKYSNYIEATAIAYISEGQVITTAKELIGDFGNPKVYIEMVPEISIKNVTEPGSITEYKMMFPLKSVFEPLMFKKLKETGFEVVSDQENSQFYALVKPIADIYRTDVFSLTLNCHIKIIDSKTSEVVTNLQGTIGPRSFTSNPSFMLDVMAENVLKNTLESLSIDIVKYLFNSYNKQIKLSLINFKKPQVDRFNERIKEALPTIIDGLRFIETKSEGNRNNTINIYEVQYIGDLDKLIGIIEKFYSIKKVEGNNITIENRQYFIKIKNCEFDLINNIRSYLDEQRLDFQIESYEKSVLTIQVNGIEDTYTFVNDFKNKFDFIIETYNSTITVFTILQRGELE